jgi:2-polyprenyl-6-methoxyphenol hydroxylase-like FAD-dependent oxidoreductase
VLDGIVAAGTAPVSRTTFRFGDETVSMSVKPSHGVSAFYAPRRPQLDAVLMAAAADAGVEIHRRVEVIDVITRYDRVVGVHATTSDHRIVELGARLVIGADGTWSTVARQVAAPLWRVTERATAVTYAYWSDVDTDSFDWIFAPRTHAGVLPTAAGLTCVFASASTPSIGADGVAFIREVVADGAPELAEQLRSPAIGPGRMSGARSGYIRRAQGPGWALVGDAGYFKDPLSAHGATDGFRDAELLAHAVLDGRDDGAMDMALARYEVVRDRVGLPVFDAVDHLAGHQWTRAELPELLLQLSSAMADEVETLAALEPERAP